MLGPLDRQFEYALGRFGVCQGDGQTDRHYHGRDMCGTHHDSGPNRFWPVFLSWVGKKHRPKAIRAAIMMGAAHIATMVMAVSLTVALANAEPAKCILELPIKRTEHWSYRIVNGQRCWFADSERTTHGRKIAIERKAQAQKSAQRSSPK